MTGKIVVEKRFNEDFLLTDDHQIKARNTAIER
jgi:hypothetical protein